jgi:hypothetical protein
MLMKQAYVLFIALCTTAIAIGTLTVAGDVSHSIAYTIVPAFFISLKPDLK